MSIKFVAIDFETANTRRNSACALGMVLYDNGVYTRKSWLIKPEPMVFGYEYDFGSTTDLTISVLEHGRDQVNRDKVTVISRNHPVEYVCDECEEKTASMICMECACMGPGFLCDDCQEDHECGEEMLSPLWHPPSAYQSLSIGRH